MWPSEVDGQRVMPVSNGCQGLRNVAVEEPGGLRLLAADEGDLSLVAACESQKG